MHNHVIILAGGIGSRLGGPMPKQFLSLNDKPVIVHTLENFERNAHVDGITIVCVKEWISYLKEMLIEYKISKVVDVIEGGATAHDSTRNGLFSLRSKLSKDDYVIIHELCHLIHFDHSKEFWNEVVRYKPDYRKNKKVLKEE